jgi:hypothetical protein
MLPTIDYFVKPYENLKLFQKFCGYSDDLFNDIEEFINRNCNAYIKLDDRDEVIIGDDDSFIFDLDLQRLLMDRYDIEFDNNLSTDAFLQLIIFWNQFVTNPYTYDRLNKFFDEVIKLRIDGEEILPPPSVVPKHPDTMNRWCQRYSDNINRFRMLHVYYNSYTSPNKKFFDSLFRLVCRCVPIDVTPTKWYYPENKCSDVKTVMDTKFPWKGLTPPPADPNGIKLKVRELKEGIFKRGTEDIIDITDKNKVSDLLFHWYWKPKPETTGLIKAYGVDKSIQSNDVIQIKALVGINEDDSASHDEFSVLVYVDKSYEKYINGKSRFEIQIKNKQDGYIEVQTERMIVGDISPHGGEEVEDIGFTIELHRSGQGFKTIYSKYIYYIVGPLSDPKYEILTFPEPPEETKLYQVSGINQSIRTGSSFKLQAVVDINRVDGEDDSELFVTINSNVQVPVLVPNKVSVKIQDKLPGHAIEINVPVIAVGNVDDMLAKRDDVQLDVLLIKRNGDNNTTINGFKYVIGPYSSPYTRPIDDPPLQTGFTDMFGVTGPIKEGDRYQITADVALSDEDYRSLDRFYIKIETRHVDVIDPSTAIVEITHKLPYMFRIFTDRFTVGNVDQLRFEGRDVELEISLLKESRESVTKVGSVGIYNIGPTSDPYVSYSDPTISTNLVGVTGAPEHIQNGTQFRLTALIDIDTFDANQYLQIEMTALDFGEFVTPTHIPYQFKVSVAVSSGRVDIGSVTVRNVDQLLLEGRDIELKLVFSRVGFDQVSVINSGTYYIGPASQPRFKRDGM